jgi:cell division septal protein FtsQ
MSVKEADLVTPIDRPPRRRRLPGWRRWLVAGGLLATVALAGWVVFISSWLGLRTVEVKGAGALPPGQVVAAADVAVGTPLARINLDAVKARVESIPAVASATVTRAWPHSLVVNVTERHQVAAIHRDGGWWKMDRTGMLFTKTRSPDPSEPIVALSGRPSAQLLPQVASVLGVLPADLLTSTRRVTASSVDSITLRLKDGSEVLWGSASDSREKAAVLHALLKRKAAVYDVSIPSRPATRA